MAAISPEGHGNAPGYALLSSVAGLPVGLAAHYGGKALQGSAAASRQADVNALLRNITGSPAPTPGGAITRGDLAKILFAQDLARLAPRVGSQVIGTRPNQQE